MPKRPQKPAKPLTPTELEMMNVIWRLGPCTVNQVVEALREQQRELAYTSVSTIVRILEQKGFVSSAREGRGHIYAALVAKQDYQAQTLRRVVTNVFDGTPSLLVQRLLDSENLRVDELEKIKALLREREK